MTIEEIIRLKEQGFSLDEIKEIGAILNNTEVVDSASAENDPEEPGPEKNSSVHEEPDNDNLGDDGQPSQEPDYKQMYEDLKEKTEKDAAAKDRSSEDEQQLEIQDAVAAFFKSKFS